jgi:uncharacterized protein YpmB
MMGLIIFGGIFVALTLWVAYEFWRAPMMQEMEDGSLKTIRPAKEFKDLFKRKK